MITEKLIKELEKAASLRNIIIHKYWEIDERKIFNSTKENIGDLAEFLKTDKCVYRDKKVRRQLQPMP